MIDLNNPKQVLAALVTAKDKLHDVARQGFIGGSINLKERTLTTANGRVQLALLESGEVVKRKRVA